MISIRTMKCKWEVILFKCFINMYMNSEGPVSRTHIAIRPPWQLDSIKNWEVIPEPLRKIWRTSKYERFEDEHMSPELKLGYVQIWWVKENNILPGELLKEKSQNWGPNVEKRTWGIYLVTLLGKIENRCSLWFSKEQMVHHILLQCVKSHILWSLLFTPFDVSCKGNTEIMVLQGNGEKTKIGSVATLCLSWIL